MFKGIAKLLMKLLSVYVFVFLHLLFQLDVWVTCKHVYACSHVWKNTYLRVQACV